MGNKITYIISSLLIWALSSCCAQVVYAPLFKCSKKMTNQYGVCSHINRKGIRNEYITREQDLSMMDKVGISFIRTDFDWIPMKAKQNDGLDYKYLDSMMMSVNSHDKSILGILTIDKRNYVSDDWLNYVTETIKRYNKNIRYWEMLSEADLIYHYVPGFYSKEYVSFLKAGYNAIKQVDRKAIVTFTGISDIYKSNIDTILSCDVSSYFDIMNVHTYTLPNSEPEAFVNFFQKLKKIMNRYNINKPVWLSETGASTYREGGDSELTQSYRLPRAFIIPFALGVDKVFWYKSRSCELTLNNKEDHYGLWHKDYSPKPAFYAYKTLTKMLPNMSTRPILERYGDVYIASWKRPDGKKVWALWTSKNVNKVHLNIGGRFTVYDLYGNTTDLYKNTYVASPSIVYIVGAKKLTIE